MKLPNLFAAVVLTGAMVSSGAAVAAESNIWSTSFDSGLFETTGPFPYNILTVVLGGASVPPAGALPGFGSQYLWNGTNGTTSFQADGLGAHTDLRLKFDLVFQDSWDSTNGSVSPDILFVDFAGQSYQWTVNNASGTTFDVGPGTVISRGTNLVGSSWTDTVVSYEFLFPHVASTFAFNIRFGGAGFQGGTDESWGIDNFALSAITNSVPVPEPATWALLIAGFGLVGAAARRRRDATA